MGDRFCILEFGALGKLLIVFVSWIEVWEICLWLDGRVWKRVRVPSFALQRQVRAEWGCWMRHLLADDRCDLFGLLDPWAPWRTTVLAHLGCGWVGDNVGA